MTKQETKAISIEKINNAVNALINDKEKVNEANIIKVSGLSRSTVQRLWNKNDSDATNDSDVSPEVIQKLKDNMHPKKEMIHIDSEMIPEDATVNSKKPKAKPVSDAFKHFLKRRPEIA